jgi:hypothetical protein
MTPGARPILSLGHLFDNIGSNKKFFYYTIEALAKIFYMKKCLVGLYKIFSNYSPWDKTALPN